MKIAVTGPVTKDEIVIDGISKEYLGGSPYYEAHTLSRLGVDVKCFITYAKQEEELVKNNFKGIEVSPLYIEKTIVHQLLYNSNNPDERTVIAPVYSPNIFPTGNKLIEELKSFDYIILGPLYYENLPFEFFEKMKGHNLVINNFGLFTYFENGKPTRKNPENLVRVAPYLKFLFLDENEIRFAAQKENIKDCADYFLKLGVWQVIVTNGSKGSTVFTKEKNYQIPAFPPKKLIDPTGAGDTYLAAFIKATELFDDIEKQGKFAAMAATMAIEKGGPFDGSLDEVIARLKEAGN